MNRLFIAIDPPAQIVSRLQSIMNSLKNAKWFTPDQIHLTLRFIGEVEGSLFQDIQQSLQSVHFDSFELKIKSVGFFPPRRQPEIVWAGVEKNESLIHLRNKIESALVRAGVTPEGRKFFPHLTLGRLKRTPSEQLAEYLTMNALFSTDSFMVDEFMLYSSFLAAEGAIHTVESSYEIYNKRKIEQ